MMNELTWPEWQEQLAFDLIECDPMERIAAILKLGFAAICQVWGADVSVDQFEPDAERRANGVDDDGYMSPEAQVAALRPQIDAGK